MRRNRTTVLGIAGTVALSVLLVFVAELVFARRFDTEHVQRRLEAMLASATDSLYVVRIGSARFSLLGRSFRITGLELHPDTAAFTRKSREGPVPTSQYFLSAASLSATSIGLWELLRKRIAVSSARIDSLRFEVRVDGTRPRLPRHPAKLPHIALQELRPIRIEELRIEHSQLRYSERAADGARFGTLRFEEFEGRIGNLTNDPLRMSAATPCEIELRALLAGAGRASVRFDYDLSTPRLNLVYRGSLSRITAKAFNEMLVDLEGLRIRDGVLDSASFQAEVRDDVARGELRLRYHDLEIETLDKVTRKRGLGDVFRTLFANRKLKGDNPNDDEPVRVARLSHRREPEIDYFKFFWHTLRDGLFATLGFSAPRPAQCSTTTCTR